jgi:hypothetical protein
MPNVMIKLLCALNGRDIAEPWPMTIGATPRQAARWSNFGEI